MAVLDIAALDTLHALGVQVAGAPEKRYVSYLDEARAGVKPVGTLHKPDFEALKAMSPDLIVIGSRAADQAPALARIAPVIDMSVPDIGTVDEAKARIAAFGALFGAVAKAVELASEIDAKTAEARAAVAGAGDALILLKSGEKLLGFGPKSRFGWLHEALGLPEAAPGMPAKPRGRLVTAEFLADVDPDWVVVIDRDAAIGRVGVSARSVLERLPASSNRAAREGRALFLDSAALYIANGGALSLMRSLDEIVVGFGR